MSDRIKMMYSATRQEEYPLKPPYTGRKLLSPLHCVSLYSLAFSYLSRSCYTVPFFLPTAIFIVIIFTNPYILTAGASPFHTTEPTEMPDFSTASTEDQAGEHTQYFHRVWPTCSWEMLRLDAVWQLGLYSRQRKSFPCKWALIVQRHWHISLRDWTLP